MDRPSQPINQTPRNIDDDLICEPSKNFYVCLFQVLFLLALLAVIIWWVERPKEPTFAIIGFSVPSSNDTPPIDVNNDTDAITYLLETHNPNQDSGIYFDDIVLAFYYEQDKIGDDRIEKFYQGKGKTLQVNNKSHNKAHANNSKAWWALRSAIMSKAKVEVKVSLQTNVRYRTWFHKISKHHGINSTGSLPIGPDGKISGKKKKIKLHRFSRKRR